MRQQPAHLNRQYWFTRGKTSADQAGCSGSTQRWSWSYRWSISTVGACSDGARAVRQFALSQAYSMQGCARAWKLEARAARQAHGQQAAAAATGRQTRNHVGIRACSPPGPCNLPQRCCGVGLRLIVGPLWRPREVEHGGEDGVGHAAVLLHGVLVLVKVEAQAAAALVDLPVVGRVEQRVWRGGAAPGRMPAGEGAEVKRS